MTPAMISIILVLAAFFGLVAIGLAWSMYLKRKRRDAFARLAEKLNCEVFIDGGNEFIGQFSDLPLFAQGDSKQVDTVLYQENSGSELWIFDYTFTKSPQLATAEESPSASTPLAAPSNDLAKDQLQSQTVICIKSAAFSMPKFELRPESSNDKSSSALGYTEIDFSVFPEFSKRYSIRGENEISVRVFFIPELVKFFEERGGLALEGSGNLFCFYHTGLVSDAELDALYGEAKDLVTVLFQIPQGLE